MVKSIYVLAMPNANDQDKDFFVLDLIDNTVYADADTIGVLLALQFQAAVRPGIFASPSNASVIR
jgi:hypothetical protein